MRVEKNEGSPGSTPFWDCVSGPRPTASCGFPDIVALAMVPDSLKGVDVRSTPYGVVYTVVKIEEDERLAVC